MTILRDPGRLALDLAARGWHVLPLSPINKRPLGNCGACLPRAGRSPHPVADCSCIGAGGWCHGVRAATNQPDRIAAWWQREPAAVPGVAAGPSELVLIDIDAQGAQLPLVLAIGLLPGIDLADEPIPVVLWSDQARFRDGRDSLTPLARLRGGSHPWPAGPECQPVTVATPTGGVHIWYRAPANRLHQVLSDPAGRYGLAWQVDVKAGWSYGVAPGAITATGSYRHRGGDLTKPGRMPDWLVREVSRVAGERPPRCFPTPPPFRPDGPGPAAYVATVIGRGAAQLATMSDGRQRALSALAYHVGGLLRWSGLDADHVVDRLVDAGTSSGLGPGLASRIVRRALANGCVRPLAAPGCRDWLAGCVSN